MERRPGRSPPHCEGRPVADLRGHRQAARTGAGFLDRTPSSDRGGPAMNSHSDRAAGLSPSERRALLARLLKERAGQLPEESTVHGLVAAQAARTPEAIAVASGAGRLTYRDLEARAGRLASHLRTLGVGPGTLVGVCLGRSTELVVALLGVLKAGGAYIPLDPGYPRARLEFMLDDARASALLTSEALLGHLPTTSARLVCLDRDWPAIEAGADGRPPAPALPRPEDLAYVIYTSGSTGRPKGAMITHRGLANYLTWAVRAYDVAGGCGAPVQSSISFDLTVTSLFT